MTRGAHTRWLLALVIATLAACTVHEGNPPDTADAESNVTETDRLNAWFETKFEEQLQFSPLSLTALGRKERYDEFDDASEAAEDEQLAWGAAAARQLRANFDYAQLTPEAQLSYDIWLYGQERNLAAAEFRDHQYIFDQMNGAQSFIPTFLINFHQVDGESDMVAYIARIGGAATALDTMLARAQKYAAGGVRPPRFAYEGVLEQAAKVISGAPFDAPSSNAATTATDSPMWADAQRKIATLIDNGSIDAARAEQLRTAARDALQQQFAPTYRRLIAWLETDIDYTADIATGVHQLPRGAAYYTERLAASTTTDMTAAQIHQLGLDEVARLRKDMLAVKSKVGFSSSLDEFFVYLRTSPEFYFPDTDAGRQRYLDEATAKIDAIRKQLPEYFGLLPKTVLVVKRVEAFRERDGAAQHYYAGTPDGSRPGVYYVHLSDMTAVPTNQLEVIAYHEGLPGHHMQIAIAQELQSLPTFRTQAHFTAYVEGWALYAESLAQEMGAYDDPYSDFGRLSSELWRAIRLVVDTGLHDKGWTEQEAIDYFKANSPEPEESIISEIRRYIVMPGQATSYKIGMLKILELRKRAEAELGARFDIRGFHDTVLGGGALPLQLLDRRVNAWIEDSR